MLEQEYNWYLANQADLAKKYFDRYLVIKGTEVLGVYETNIAALTESQKNHKVGTFLIQHCLPGKEVQTFYSDRVAFYR